MGMLESQYLHQKSVKKAKKLRIHNAAKKIQRAFKKYRVGFHFLAAVRIQRYYRWVLERRSKQFGLGIKFKITNSGVVPQD